jgi:hypothetical protein
MDGGTRVTAPHPDRPADVLRKHLRVNGLSHAADQPLVDAIAGAFAELHPEVALLHEMAVLDLRPGDILVFTTDRSLSDEEHDFMLGLIKSEFPDHRCVVLERAQLAVVRPGGEAAST